MMIKKFLPKEILQNFFQNIIKNSCPKNCPENLIFKKFLPCHKIACSPLPWSGFV
jgi:hypothetical protein